MTSIPETHYAKTVDGVHIAYQVFGEGPVDLIFSFGEVSNVDAQWDLPEFASFMRRLAAFSRVVVFDSRGNGLSDRDLGNASFEAGMDDIRAVMDAAGSEGALQFGYQDGGMLCALFTASFPERTSGLILLNSSARGLWAPTSRGAGRRRSGTSTWPGSTRGGARSRMPNGNSDSSRRTARWTRPPSRGSPGTSAPRAAPGR